MQTLDYAQPPPRRSYKTRIWFWFCYIVGSFTAGPFVAISLALWKLEGVQNGEQSLGLSLWFVTSLIVAGVWWAGLADMPDDAKDAHPALGYLLGVLSWCVVFLVLYGAVILLSPIWTIRSWP